MLNALTDIIFSIQWVGTIATGLAYAIAVLGVFLTFRILHFPDLTIDGSFPLGAGVAAVLTLHGWSHWAALPVAAVAGGVAGAATATLTNRLKINGLLSSILVALALTSINLRLLGWGAPMSDAHGPTANLPLLNTPTIVQGVNQWLHPLVHVCREPTTCLSTGVINRYAQVLVFGAIVALIASTLYWFLNTELGLALRAAGDNPQMVQAQGINSQTMQLVGLVISNALIALSGALIIASLGFADITLGRGLIIVGLAAIIIGEVVLSPKTMGLAVLGSVIGSLLYRVFITVALRYTHTIGLQETDLQLLTALIVILALGLPQLRSILLPRRTR
ncbi:MAG: ABC transporter permease [Herpetosiphon sp.]